MVRPGHSPTHDLAWLAGFWDGEGCVSTLQKYATPQFSLSQAGEEGKELCQRVALIAGDGRVHGPYKNRPNEQPHYKVRITGGHKVQALLDACRPWLSRTKINQAERVLARWHEYRAEHHVRDRKGATHCQKGLLYDEKNTYITKSGARRCRRCHADFEKNRRQAG